MNGYRTLYDEEQEKKKVEDRINKVRSVIGDRKNLPFSLKGKYFNLKGVEPRKFFKKAGYTFCGSDYGWVRKIDKKYRFHAVLTLDDRAIIHTDLIKKRDGKKVHIASSLYVTQEKRRLGQLLPPELQKVTLSKKKKHNIYLPHEDYLKAMENLKNQTPKRESFFVRICNKLKFPWSQ